MCDTLVLSRLLSPSLEGGHSLAAWGQRLGFPKDDFSDWDGGLTPEMEKYCIQDTLVTEKLYKHLVSELKHQKFDQRSIDLEHKVQAIIAKQERNGFKLDERKATILLSELQTKLSVIEAEMQRIFPPKYVAFKGTPRNMVNVVTFEQIPEEHRCRIIESTTKSTEKTTEIL